MEGLGDALADQLVDKKMVSDVADLYTLKEAELAALERMGQKSAANLLHQIEASKKKELSKLLFGLGVRHVGANAAYLLAGHFGTMEGLARAQKEDLEGVGAIGEVIAESVLKFFKSKENMKIIERLERLGVNMRQPKKEGVSPAVAPRSSHGIVATLACPRGRNCIL